MPESRILLADRHRAFVEALALRLAAEPGLHVVAAVTAPDEALRVVRSRPVDVAVLAADDPEADFVALAGDLVLAQPTIKMVGLTGEGEVALLGRAVRKGFRAWVPKDVGIPSLLDVLQAVSRGETCIPPLVLTRLLEFLMRDEQAQGAAAVPFTTLTAREREVLQAMSTGASRSEIADRLLISTNTVRTHMQSILNKLDVHTTLAAVALARRAGVG
jgi:DNA-binding NarL/FixJ family response regulator